MLGKSREVSGTIERVGIMKQPTVQEEADRLLHLFHKETVTYRGIPVVTSSHLTETITITRVYPTSFTLVERFFLWVESLCERSEIYYYWRKIPRTVTVTKPMEKVILMGGKFYCHPMVLETLQQRYPKLLKYRAECQVQMQVDL